MIVASPTDTSQFDDAVNVSAIDGVEVNRIVAVVKATNDLFMVSLLLSFKNGSTYSKW